MMNGGIGALLQQMLAQQQGPGVSQMATTMGPMAQQLRQQAPQGLGSMLGGQPSPQMWGMQVSSDPEHYGASGTSNEDYYDESEDRRKEVDGEDKQPFGYVRVKEGGNRQPSMREVTNDRYSEAKAEYDRAYAEYHDTAEEDARALRAGEISQEEYAYRRRVLGERMTQAGDRMQDAEEDRYKERTS